MHFPGGLSKVTQVDISSGGINLEMYPTDKIRKETKMSLIQLEFRNMTADAELAKHAATKLNRIHALAPAGSACVTVLEKTGRVYRCSMEICSRLGPFVFTAESASAWTAVDLLLEKTEKKLAQWQERRFERALAGSRDQSSGALTARPPVIAGTA
jgi:ribosome-associated translation inhibitor RaiA